MSSSEAVPSRLRFWIFLLLTTAALLRLTYALEMGQGFEFQRHEWRQTDMHFFVKRGRQISYGDWWSRSISLPRHSWLTRIQTRKQWKQWLGKRFYQSPGYSYVVAVSLSLWGSVWPVKIFQMMLGVLSLFLLYSVGRSLFSWRVGLLAAIGGLLYGPFLYLEPMLLRTTLLTFVGLALLALVVRLRNQPSILAAGLLGLLLGLAVLFKATWLLLLGFLPLLLRKSEQVTQSKGKVWVVLGLGFCMAISPLVVRNIVVGASPASMSANGPLVFVQGNAPDAKPQPNFRSRYFKDIFLKAQGRLLPTVTQTLGSHSIWSFLKLHFVRMWAVFRMEEAPNNTCFALAQKQSSILGFLRLNFLLLTPFALMGWFLMASGSTRERWALWVLLAFLLLHATSWLWGGHMMRYRITAVPLFLLGAAYLLERLIVWVQQRELKSVAITVGAAIVLALLINVPSHGRVVPIRVADYLSPMLHAVKTTRFEEGCKVATFAAQAKPQTFKRLETLMCGCWKSQKACLNQQCQANLWKSCRSGFFRELGNLSKRRAKQKRRKSKLK